MYTGNGIVAGGGFAAGAVMLPTTGAVSAGLVLGAVAIMLAGFGMARLAALHRS